MVRARVRARVRVRVRVRVRAIEGQGQGITGRRCAVQPPWAHLHLATSACLFV